MNALSERKERLMPDVSFRRFRDLSGAEEKEEFRTSMEGRGYYGFFAFIEDFRETLKAYSDDDAGEVGRLISEGRAMFPNPGRFSPSWDRLWEEFEGIYRAKNEALTGVPASERSGEWQVLIDNPYVPLQVVCYPGLAFAEASYMYAYFQKDLKPNELLRLQKVTHLLMTNGLKMASIFPDV